MSPINFVSEVDQKRDVLEEIDKTIESVNVQWEKLNPTTRGELVQLSFRDLIKAKKKAYKLECKLEDLKNELKDSTETV